MASISNYSPEQEKSIKVALQENGNDLLMNAANPEGATIYMSVINNLLRKDSDPDPDPNDKKRYDISSELSDNVRGLVSPKFQYFLETLEAESRDNPHYDPRFRFLTDTRSQYRDANKGIIPSSIVTGGINELGLNEDDSYKMYSYAQDTENEGKYGFDPLFTQEELYNLQDGGKIKTLEARIAGLQEELFFSKQGLKGVTDTNEIALREASRNGTKGEIAELEQELKDFKQKASNAQGHYRIRKLSELEEKGVQIEISDIPIEGKINIACLMRNNEEGDIMDEMIQQVIVYVGKFGGVNIGTDTKGNVYALDGYGEYDGEYSETQKQCFEILRQSNEYSPWVYISRK